MHSLILLHHAHCPILACAQARLRKAGVDIDRSLARAAAAREAADGKCTFCFVRADFIKQSPLKTLPHMQELERTSNALVQLPIGFVEAFRGAFNTGEYLVVSHRWFDIRAPDPDGTQMRAIQEHLRAHPEIKYIWFDYCPLLATERSAPQHSAAAAHVP